MLQRGQPRQQDPAGFLLIARQRQRTFKHIARREHAELVSQLTRTATTIEHRDDGIDTQPGILLQPAEQAGEPGPTSKAADVQLPQLHVGIVQDLEPRI